MFDEFDILQKEISNDFFKLECVVECSFIQNKIESFEDYTTEAEGSSIKDKFNALAEKVKEIFSKIIERVAAASGKIRGMIVNKFQEDKINSLTKKLVAIKNACSKNKEFEKEVTEELKKYEWYDTKELCKDIRPYYTTIGDKIQAVVKTLFNKLRGGKRVTSQDIAELKAMSSTSIVKPLKKYRVLSGISNLVTYAAEAMSFYKSVEKAANSGSGKDLIVRDVAQNLTSDTKVYIAGVAGYAASSIAKEMDLRARKKIEKNRAILADKRVAAAEMSAAEVYGAANELSSLAARCTSALASAEAQGNADQIRALNESLNQIQAICNSLEAKAKTINKSDSDE